MFVVFIRDRDMVDGFLMDATSSNTQGNPNGLYTLEGQLGVNFEKSANLDCPSIDDSGPK